MKQKIKGMSLLVTALMLITIATPIFAQSDTDPSAEPTPIVAVSSFVDHPIVKLLASFFQSLFAPAAIEEPFDAVVVPIIPADPLLVPDPNELPAADEIEPALEPLPVVIPEEAIAALHTEQDLGFGEITKLLQIMEEAKVACAAEGIKCDLTMDSLVAEYKAGAGMGELFKTYGKPEFTGVGQVRKATELEIKSNNGKGKGKSK